MSYAERIGAIRHLGYAMADAVLGAAQIASEADDVIAAKDAEIAGLRTALDRLLCATEGHDVCPYAKAEARYVLTPEGK